MQPALLSQPQGNHVEKIVQRTGQVRDRLHTVTELPLGNGLALATTSSSLTSLFGDSDIARGARQRSIE